MIYQFKIYISRWRQGGRGGGGNGREGAGEQVGGNSWPACKGARLWQRVGSPPPVAPRLPQSILLRPEQACVRFALGNNVGGVPEEAQQAHLHCQQWKGVPCSLVLPA